jgi:hypothetical protein
LKNSLKENSKIVYFEFEKSILTYIIYYYCWEKIKNDENYKNKLKYIDYLRITLTNNKELEVKDKETLDSIYEYINKFIEIDFNFLKLHILKYFKASKNCLCFDEFTDANILDILKIFQNRTNDSDTIGKSIFHPIITTILSFSSSFKIYAASASLTLSGALTKNKDLSSFKSNEINFIILYIISKSKEHVDNFFILFPNDFFSEELKKKIEVRIKFFFILFFYFYFIIFI